MDDGIAHKFGADGVSREKRPNRHLDGDDNTFMKRLYLRGVAGVEKTSRSGSSGAVGSEDEAESG